MLGQTFQPSDLVVVGFLVVLEALLSADNALVLAIMVRHLPRELQRKALLYGLGGAFVFRFFAILLATVVIRLWWLQAIGAAYLIFLMTKHFVWHVNPKKKTPKQLGFWGTVASVELADIAFAIDSVLAGVAVIRGAQDKTWVVFLGAMMGVVLLRVGAGLVINLLERYPVLDHMAYLLVGWVGVKLVFLAGHNYARANPGQFGLPEMPPAVFWGVLAVIVAGGVIAAMRQARAAKTDEPPTYASPSGQHD